MGYKKKLEDLKVKIKNTKVFEQKSERRTI